MTAERKSRIDEIFGAALELSAADRLSFLERECGPDAEIREEVERLLTAHQQAGSFLRTPLVSFFQGLEPGDTLGRYRIESEIGRGGMGIVYLAKDTQLGRTVAIKVFPETSWEDEVQRARFSREVRAAATLNHPNVSSVYDVGEQDGRYYLVMEHVPGRQLTSLIPPNGLSPQQAWEYARPIAEALAAAHSAGIVHRDVKPANVMVLPGGGVKVLDFGIARLLDSTNSASPTINTVAGTPAYMAPEQIAGQRADPRSDIYSFGILLHELLTGTASLGAIHRVPVDLARVIARSVDQDPARRFQGMEQVKAAFGRAVAGVDSAQREFGQAIALGISSVFLVVAVMLYEFDHPFYALLVPVIFVVSCIAILGWYPRWSARRHDRRAAAEALRVGRMLIEQQEYPAAVTYLKQATALSAGTAAAHAALASAYSHCKNYLEAVKSYSEALRLASTNSELSEYRFQRGRAHSQSGDFVQAKIDFTDLIQSSSGGHAAAFAERGLIWLGQDEQSAAMDFKKAIDVSSQEGAHVDPNILACCTASLAALAGIPDAARRELGNCHDASLTERFAKMLAPYINRTGSGSGVLT